MILGFGIAAIAFALSACLFYYCLKDTCFIRFSAISFAIFVFSALVGTKYVVFALYVGLCVYVIRADSRNFLSYYLILLPAFPLAIYWSISIPGIDTLFVINHQRILILGIFFPLLLRLLNKGVQFLDESTSYVGIVDRLLFAYLLIQIFVMFRDNNILVAARHSLLIIIDIWIPYFVISRSAVNTNSVLVILLYTAVAFSIISILEQKLFYRIYDIITLAMGDSYKFPKLRGGELRAYAFTGNPLVLGFFYGMIVLLGLKFRSLVKSPIYMPWLIFGILLLGIESTGSRSPLLSVAIGMLVLVWWSKGRSMVSNTAIFVFPIMFIFIIWFATDGIYYLLAFDDGDDGTFRYRYDLILNAAHLIQQNLFFGVSAEVIFNDPILERSRQGEGIIDITNTYLFILLNSGLFALLFYIGIWCALIRGLYRVPAVDGVSATLMATCAVVMIMLFISSSISFIFAYCWLLISITCGYLRQWEKPQGYQISLK